MSARRVVVSVFVVVVGALVLASASALAAAPEVTIEGESSSGVSATEARLEATVNPGGSETSYHFEYGPSAGSYDVSIPVAGAELPAGEVGVSVSAAATGLTPGTAYHYRVVASNAQPGVVDGPDEAFTTPAAQGTGSPPACSNELRRAEQPFGLELPDCRAYEMVSPLETIGQDATDSFLQTTLTRAAVSGEAITYQSRGSFAKPYGSAFENQFLSRRGSDGWSTQSITLPREAYGAETYANYFGLEFTPELSEGVARSIGTPLTSEAPVGLAELYLADFSTGSYQWLSDVPDDEVAYKHAAGNSGAWVMGASTDLSHVVFATAGDGLGVTFEWLKGKTVPVDVANSGEFMSNAGVGTLSPYGGMERPWAGDLWHAVSSDGSRVFFTSHRSSSLYQSGNNLYVRENSEQPQSPTSGEECTVPSDACTVEVSASQKTDGIGPGGMDPNEGSARYWGASADGSKVLFTSDQELTNNANTGISDRQEVIVRNASGGTYTLTFKGQTTGPIPGEATPAEVQSALEALPLIGAGNVTVSPGAVEVGVVRDVVTFGGALASSEQPSMTADGSSLSTGGTVSVSVLARPGNDLYEYDVEDGKLTDLTADSGDADGAAVQGVVQISEDGSYVYFVARGVLAAGALAGGPNLYVLHEGGAPRFIATLGEGVDNDDWYGGGRNEEGESAGPEVNSAVVSPDGTRLAFMSYRELTGYDNHDANTGEPDDEIYLYNVDTNTLACASCNPSGARPIGSSKLRNSRELETAQAESTQYRSRSLLEDGALFFDSSDALVPHASDGRQNVYEYEDGHVYPISNVAGGFESFFMDASTNGENVFFGTADQLLPQDVSNNVVVYDARVGGGFPITVSPPPCDNGDSCKPPPAAQPSVFGAPGSATFSGAGNIAPAVVVKLAAKPKAKTLKCKKGYVKKNGKCVKKSKSKKAKKSTHGKGSK